MGLFFWRKNKAYAQAEQVESNPTAAQEKPASEGCLEADVIASDTHAVLDSGLDLSDFWYDTKESRLRHTCPPLNDETLRSVEQRLGHRLPKSYVQLMRQHNGGLVNRCRYPVPNPKQGCPDTVYITDIMGIGDEVPYSLCGSFGSDFLIQTRGHKAIGIALCNTTLPGRALVFLDYRGADDYDEPRITWADAQEHIELPLARNFNEFVKGLV